MDLQNLFRLYLSRLFTHPLVDQTTFDIMTTYQCNMRCRMCNVWRIYTKDPNLIERELNLNDFEKLAFELKGLRCKTVELQGGEPFLREDIFEIIEIMKKHDLETKIVSNGTLITKEFAEAIVGSCISITLSLDGYNPADHERNRGVEGSFKKVVKGIDNMVQARNMFNRDFKVFTQTTYTDHNLSSPKKIIKLARKMGVDGIHFVPASMGCEANFRGELGERNGIKDIEGYKKVVQELLELKNEYGTFIRTPYLYLKFSTDYIEDNDFAKSFPCFAGYYYGLIGAWGEVYLCAGWSDSMVGNIKKSLIEAYHSGEAKEVRKMMKDLECPGCYLGCQRFYDLGLSLTPRILREKIFSPTTLRHTIDETRQLL